MELAILEAWKYQFLTYPNPAVGATVVKKLVIPRENAVKPNLELPSLK